jgi:polysaccharide biosynthesis PFTS motif protein
MRPLNRFIYKIKFYLYLKDHLKIMRHRKKKKNIFSTFKSKIFDLDYSFEKYFTNKVFNNLPISFEIFFKQYNFLRLIHGSKISLYILNLKKVSYPLTREQIKLFKKNDYNVNLFISYLLFFLFSLREFVTGIFIFLIINISSIYNIFKFTYKKKNEFFINNLRKDQILSFNKVPNNLKNFISKKFNLKDHRFVHNNKDCKNLYKFNFLSLPKIDRLSEVFKFNIYFFKFSFLILLDLLFLRIKQIFIFSEMVKLCCTLSKEKSYYKDNYFFFSEPPFFRPLYSYSLGKNVFYIENHLNINPLYYQDGTRESEIYWKNLTWSNYLVWNNEHKNFIKKNQIIDAKYFICGPISFGTSNVQGIKDKIPKSILVLDAIPFRKSYFSNYNVYLATYLEDNIIKFLQDIYMSSEKYSLYLKPKRNQRLKIFSKKYNRYFEINNKFNILNPTYSVVSIINRFDKIICLPFSSVGWIAKKMNKKVCYYDVVGIHEDLGDIINDVKLIRNFPDLQKWVNS